VATYVYASSQGQRKHSAWTNIFYLQQYSSNIPPVTQTQMMLPISELDIVKEQTRQATRAPFSILNLSQD
jgi:hypothetical protein